MGNISPSYQKKSRTHTKKKKNCTKNLGYVLAQKTQKNIDEIPPIHIHFI